MYKKEHYKEKQRIASRKWYAKHRDEVVLKRGSPESKKMRQKSMGARRRRRRLELIAHFGNKCVRCGFTDWRALQIDHINGGGNKERKAMNFDTQLDSYRKHIMESPEKFQLLCANCNWIKRYENKEERTI